MNNLYDYVLHFNPYKKLWFAIPRTQCTSWFADNSNNKGVLKSDKLSKLLKIIK